jgi:hypothetical protein
MAVGQLTRSAHRRYVTVDRSYVTFRSMKQYLIPCSILAVYTGTFLTGNAQS